MKNISVIVCLIVLLLSCKKSDTNSSNQIDLTKLPGKWKFISESRTGDDKSDIRAKYETETLTYKNGIAYSSIQGQFVYFYNYNINSTDKSLLFLYMGPGCTNNCQFANRLFWGDLINNNNSSLIMEAKIQRLDDNYLIMGNTFTVYDSTVKKNFVVTVVDSLSR